MFSFVLRHTYVHVIPLIQLRDTTYVSLSILFIRPYA